MGEVNGVTIIDDYGHHPVEISAVLRAQGDKFGTSYSRSSASEYTRLNAYSRFLFLF